MTEHRTTLRNRMLLGMLGAVLVVGVAVPLLHTGPQTPPPPAPPTAIDRLWVLGSREVVVGESYPTPSPQRWYSGDAGRSWRPVSGGVTSTVDAVPAGGVLEVACADPAKPPFLCEAATLLVTLPGTGELATLTNRPDLE